MDVLSFMVMLVVLSQLIVGAGIYLIYSGKRNSALAGAGLIAVSTMPLFALADLKEIQEEWLVYVIIASFLAFAVLVALKALSEKTNVEESFNSSNKKAELCKQSMI